MEFYTIEHGYLDLYNNLNQLVSDDSLPISQLEKAMMQGKIELTPRNITNIALQRQEALQNFYLTLQSNISQKLKNKSELAGICYFGGGVEQLRPYAGK